MTEAEKSGSRPRRTRFFATTGLIFAVMVVLSFPVTYFGPVLSGTTHFRLLRHLHGLAFFLWISLYAWQTRLASLGRIARHRELGLAGFAISGALLPLGVWMALAAGAERAAAGKPQPYATTFYNAVDIGLFALLMAASIMLVTRRPDWHRRLTFAAALNLVGPAISRWVLLLPEVFPITDFAPNIIADLFLLALALHDRRESGRVHPATWLAVALMVPLHIVSPWIAAGQGWNALAQRLLGAA